jgi:hypothetical protein
MHPAPPPTDRPRAARLASTSALSALLVASGSLGPLERRWGVGLVFVGALLALRLVAPRAAAAIDGGARRAGELVGAALLTILYVLVVAPYALALRVFGVVPGPDEPWPPATTSTWTPVEAGGGEDGRARALTGSVAATLMLRAGDAVALASYFARRPSLFLLPIVALVLALAAFVLVGNATGLGPLIYPLF